MLTRPDPDELHNRKEECGGNSDKNLNRSKGTPNFFLNFSKKKVARLPRERPFLFNHHEA
jgi:hypothetical protein